MRKKHWIFGGLSGILTALCLTGCLIPVEEVYEPVPTVDAGTVIVVQTAPCLREDLTDIANLSVRYVPVRSEDLYFVEDSVPYSDFYVKAGENVSAGDLLAKLDTDAEEEALADLVSQAEVNENAFRQLEQEYDLTVRRQNILDQNLSWQERTKAHEKNEERYTLKKQELEDQKGLLDLNMQILRERIEARKIYAPFDGVITYLYSPDRGELSSLTRKVMSISDSTLSVFRGETKDYAYFPSGATFVVTTDTNEYPVTVVSAEELGLSDDVKPSDPETHYVYLQVSEEVYDLKDNVGGRTFAVRAESKDTLTVPVKAVTEIGGKAYVYCPTENGVRTIREVTTGLTNGKKTEILSGLSEGDLVIVN